MPKSRNRKNHKKKVAARKMRVAAQQKQMMKQMEKLQQTYADEMAQKAKEGNESADVPFTLENQ